MSKPSDYDGRGSEPPYTEGEQHVLTLAALDERTAERDAALTECERLRGELGAIVAVCEGRVHKTSGGSVERSVQAIVDERWRLCEEHGAECERLRAALAHAHDLRVAALDKLADLLDGETDSARVECERLRARVVELEVGLRGLLTLHGSREAYQPVLSARALLDGSKPAAPVDPVRRGDVVLEHCCECGKPVLLLPTCIGCHEVYTQPNDERAIRAACGGDWPVRGALLDGAGEKE